jgi:DNA-binding NarL/FixJ family response regulator
MSHNSEPRAADPSQTVRALLDPEHPLARVELRVRALHRALMEQLGCECVEAHDGRGALEAARRAHFDLVLLDLNLPDVDGYEVCRELRARYGPALPVIFVSGERKESFDRVAGLLIGADDYLTKPFAPDELLTRLRSLLRRAAPSAPAAVERLTSREREVLGLLADGLNQRQIATLLVISPKTVGTHIERILQKLGVHSRAQAVAVAYRDELVA